MKKLFSLITVSIKRFGEEMLLRLKQHVHFLNGELLLSEALNHLKWLHRHSFTAPR